MGGMGLHGKKIREKSRECDNHKPQPFLEEEETDKAKQAQIKQTYEALSSPSEVIAMLK